MTDNDLREALEVALVGRRLLTHPFYQRWEAGELTIEELGAYAEQYRHVEAFLPEALEGVVLALPEGNARKLVEENLADERGHPAPHVEMFEGFADAVHAGRDAYPTMATLHLIETYASAVETNAVAGIAAIAAYEVQAAEIATTKALGLRKHYGLDESATEFWDVHGEMEMHHASWSIDALSSLAADPSDVYGAARASADAWWAFLDEREVFAKAGV
jgi:pyrroloquinoline-quinone synthase